jgi:hypothetical protein
MGLLSLILRMGYDDSDVKSGMKRTESAVSGFRSRVGSELKGMVAGAFTIGAVTQFARSVVEAGDKIGDLADQWHISTDEVQRLEILASRTGVKIERIGEALVKFSEIRQKAVGGDKKSLEILEKYGLTWAQLSDNSKGNLELVTKISDKYSKVSGSAEAQADALDIAGTRGQKVLSVMTQIKDLGPISIINKDDINELSKANDALDELKRQAIVAAAPGAGIVGGALKNINESSLGPAKYLQPAMIGALASSFYNRFFGNKPEPTNTDGPSGPNYGEPSTMMDDLEWTEWAAKNPGKKAAAEKVKADRKSNPFLEGGSLAAQGGFFFGQSYNQTVLQSLQAQVKELEKISKATVATATVITKE